VKVIALVDLHDDVGAVEVRRVGRQLPQGRIVRFGNDPLAVPLLVGHQFRVGAKRAEQEHHEAGTRRAPLPMHGPLK
jgi:hypothetical protein